MANGPAATETRHLRTLFGVGAAGILTDGQLLERFATQAGDPAELAFAALVERHGPMVLRVARSALNEDHSAHDAFQATFLILARKARSLWVRDSLGPWLHAVAHRVASQSRSAQARRRVTERQAARPESYQGRDGDRTDLARAIHQEIDRLPQPYRLAVVTCHLEGLTQHEAADRLGWPVGTLQSRLARGRHKLREGLKRRGLAPSLGVLGGQFAPVPHALTASTARLAATLHLKASSAGMIAPAVLAMIETTTKGMLMIKVKLGALALLTAFGIVAATGTINLGQEPRRTDAPTVVTPQPADQAKPTSGPPTTSPIEEVKLATEARITQPEPTPPPLARQAGRESVQAGLITQPEPIPPPLDGPGFPVLLDFHAGSDEISLRMRSKMTELSRVGYPIKSIDIESTTLNGRYNVKSIPTFIVVDGKGLELNRLQGEVSAATVARFYNDSRPKDPFKTIFSKAFFPEPSLDVLPAPRPWETVVRVRVLSSDQQRFLGSGAVIASNSKETIVLTTANSLKAREGEVASDVLPRRGPARVPEIRIDLFDGKFTGRSPARVGPDTKDLTGELIDRDEVHNLALIRIHPGRVLPAARVVPSDKKPVRGMRLYSLGCSKGADATAWDTVILDPSFDLTAGPTRSSITTIKCAYRPEQGRSGGGLYTTEGELMGLCLYSDDEEKVGLYAQPQSIRNLLDRNGLAYVHGIEVTRIAQPQTKPAGRDPILKSSRVVYEERPVGRNEVVPNPDLLTPQPPTDRERLDELERKLDRVLKILDAFTTESRVKQDRKIN